MDEFPPLSLPPEKRAEFALLGEILPAILDGAEDAEQDGSPDGAEDVAARVRAAIAEHGSALDPVDRTYFEMQSEIMSKVLANERALHEAMAEGDTARAEDLRAEFVELRRQGRELDKWRHLPPAAKALVLAEDLETFREILPEVAVDRLYGEGYGKTVSPFPLIWAISARDRPLERVQLMLARGARLDLRTGLKETVLHAMAGMNRKGKARLAILRLLVLRGAELEARNVQAVTPLGVVGVTPLGVSISRGSLEDVETFLAVGARVGLAEMQAAARHPAKLARVLDHLAQAEAPGLIAEFSRWLREAVAHAKLWQAERDNAYTAREHAALAASLDLVAARPGYRAEAHDRKVTWREEPSAFVAVKAAPTLEALREVLDRVDMTSHPRDTLDPPIFWPIRAKADRPQRLWMMLAAGTDVTDNRRGDGGVLHDFARVRRTDREEQLAIARMLVQAGAALEAPDFEGFTPLGVAVMRRGVAETAALLAVGASPNLTVRTGYWASRTRRVPLLFAAGWDARILRLLIDHGVDDGRRMRTGETLAEYLDGEIAAFDADLARTDWSGTAVREMAQRRRGLLASRALLQARG
jgi:hypothetical protein